eukprot:3069923-Pyramimonas_sp.AAC.1
MVNIVTDYTYNYGLEWQQQQQSQPPSHRGAVTPVSDWSVMRIYPRFLRPIGPSGENSCAADGRRLGRLAIYGPLSQHTRWRR